MGFLFRFDSWWFCSIYIPTTNRPLWVCFQKVLSWMICFSEKESCFQINVLKEMKSPWLAAKKPPNEITFPSRDFKWLIKSSAFCVKCLCLFCAFWDTHHKYWYKHKDDPKIDECACPLSIEAKALSVSHTWVV